MTTTRPASWATRAASQLTTPSCSHRQRAPADYRFVGVWHAQLRTAEHVHDVEWPGRLNGFRQGGKGGDAHDLALARVDRHAVVALLDQVAEDAEGWAGRLRGRAHDGDPAARAEDVLDSGVVQQRNRPAALLEVEDVARPCPFVGGQVAASRS